MKLADLTQKAIEQFAGAKIYARGLNYHRSGNVSNLSYHPATESITAEVAGNYGDYDVEIQKEGGNIRASCSCPYDGYPCKHIVAVLLSYINNSLLYAEQAEEEKTRNFALEKRIQMLSQQELAVMVMECARKYPDFKRDLMLRFDANPKRTLDALRKQISRAFPPIESRSYSTHRIAKELKNILQSVESADERIRMEVHWDVADSILHELNEYGMNDEALEGLLVSSFEVLHELLVKNDALTPRRREIIQELMRYYNRGNCGMVDTIFDTVMDLSSEREDFQLVIEKLESRKKSSSYIREQLASLYSLIGDEEAELEVLQRDLQYGMDYWRLAEYWLGRGEHEQAMEVVREGIKKGIGRKQELYDFLQNDCESRKDYDGLVRLLQMKAQGGDLSHGSLGNDPIYQSLKRFYEDQGDYTGRMKLLHMSMERNGIDLRLYREAQETLEKKDWDTFEKEVFQRLSKEQEASKSAWSTGPSRTLRTLAEICAYRGDLKQLFDAVKGDHQLLVEYEKELLALHASHYLKEYRTRVERLISERGRGNYQQAVEYLTKVRRIYRDTEKQPEEWDRYIRGIKESNKSLRALLEELGKAGLIV